MNNIEIVIFTLAMFFVYLALRYPFFQLPLHIDTGFYVSNHTICTRKFNFSQGWNAHFAGCSKVLPELFYSLIYLLHGGKRYKIYSRFYYSLYNYLTAILVGYAAYILGGRSELLYYNGLIAYCLLSSEPHYGIYFESGEQFELPFQVMGFLLIWLGIESQNAYLVAGGIGLWLLEAFFIKLSSLISSGILALGAIVLLPETLLPIIMAGLVTAALYLGWILINRKNPLELIKPMAAHESHFGHHLTIKDRVSKKFIRSILRRAWFLWDIHRFMPIVPGLAMLGAVLIGNKSILFVMYITAVIITYFFQSAQIWYYTLPFLPVWAILAAFSIDWLISQGINGIAVTFLLGFLWLAIHLIQSYGRLLFRGLASLNRYVWRLYGTSMADKNLHLDETAILQRSFVKGQSMFIFGSWNQAYLLIESSYDVPLVSATRWLDYMMPGWIKVLNDHILRDPPAFLLDTDDCLDVKIMQENLGLDYRLITTFGSQFRLFAFNGFVTVGKINLDCQPYVFIRW